MSESSMKARIVLEFLGEALTPDELSARVALKPTRLWKQGEVINSVPLIKAQHGTWRHALPLLHPMGEDIELDQFLNHLIARKAALQQIADAGMQVNLRLHVETDTLQMVYQLTPNTLQKLTELGLCLDVASVSWGESGF